MTLKERVLKSLEANMDGDTIDKLLQFAYYMGRETATKSICDRHNEIIKMQKERANQCRYHKLAADIIGQFTFIYSDDYDGDFIDAFGDDKTNL